MNRNDAIRYLLDLRNSDNAEDVEAALEAVDVSLDEQESALNLSPR